MPAPRAKSLPVPSGSSAERLAGQLVAAVQRGDDGVQAAVAAGHDDPARARAVQDAVELARVRVAATSTEADSRRIAERQLERLLVGRARAGVGDHEEGVHWRDLSPTGRHPMWKADHDCCARAGRPAQCASVWSQSSGARAPELSSVPPGSRPREGLRCPRSSSSVPSGAMKARARRPTCSPPPSASTSSSAPAAAHNAGHTIVVDGEKFATHLLPERDPHAGRDLA